MYQHSLTQTVAGPGLPVFPVTPGGKTPLTPHGFKDATRDTAQIREWWTRHPQANIGMPTGAATYDVLDVDVRPSGDGWAAFHRLNETGLLAGALWMVRTPSSGIHLYFPGTSQPSSSMPEHHLDLKATGGYVLLPPSYVVTDAYEGTYTREADYSAEATGEPLDWAACRSLLAPATVPGSASPRTRTADVEDIGALATWLRRQGEGNRNRALYWAARRALEQGSTQLDVLAAAAIASGLPEREADRTLASALRGSAQ